MLEFLSLDIQTKLNLQFLPLKRSIVVGCHTDSTAFAIYSANITF